jgi:hypothetical protein
MAESRGGHRSNVFLAATLVTAGGSAAVRVRNISARGALIDGAGLPPEGAAVELRRGSLAAQGEVAWHDAGHCGIRFSAAIDVDVWTRKVGHAGQQAVDQIVALARRPVTGDASPARQTPHDDGLAAIGDDLEAVCDRLAGHPELVAGCSEELLKLDAIAQRLRTAIRRGIADS